MLCSSLLGNELELVFHLGKEVFLGLKLVASFFNEFFWSALDVLWITEAGLESVDFVAELEDVLLEVGLVLAMDVGRNLQIDVMARDSEAEAGNLGSSNFWHAWSLGQMLNEELVFINELIVDKGDWIATGTWKCLVVAAYVGDDSDKLAELVGLLLVDLEWLWPVLGDNHAVGPAEALPNGFCDEWHEA